MFPDNLENHRPGALKNPDTERTESAFREEVRNVLGLSWEARDAAVFAELKRLKEQDTNLKANQQRKHHLAQAAYRV